MVSIEHISKKFGDKVVIRDLDFVFPDAAVTSIRGASGTGKTTLLNIVLGLLPPDSGTVHGTQGRRLGAVFQEDRLIEQFSAGDNVRIAAHPDVSPDEIRRGFDRLGLEGVFANRVSKCSGGMKRRIAILRAIYARPEILALDEPFKGLDVAAKLVTAHFILENCKRATILLVSHDSQEAELLGANAVLPLD